MPNDEIPPDPAAKMAELQEADSRTIVRESVLAIMRCSSAARVAATEAVAAGLSRGKFVEVCGATYDMMEKAYVATSERLAEAERGERDGASVERGGQT